MRHLLRTLSLVCAIALACAGVFVMHDSRDLAALLPQGQQTKVDYVDKQVEATTDLEMNTPADLKASSGDDDALYYVHEKGFVGHSSFDNATTSEKVTTDAQGRVSRIVYRLTPDDSMMYTTGPSDNASVFAPHSFTSGGVEVGITAYAWRGAVHPLLSNITSWVAKAKSDAVVVIDLSYNSESEAYARYITVRAYSPEDDGVALNVNTDVYNYDKTVQVDYESGTTAASASAATSSADGSAADAGKTGTTKVDTTTKTDTTTSGSDQTATEAGDE